MSIKLTRRIGALILKRGRNSIRIKPDSIDDAKKAITREDIRSLISKGGVYALEEKHNESRYAKGLAEKKAEGRRRGPGRRKGTTKARTGMTYKKKIRAQRRIIKDLKATKAIDNEMFKEFYALVKGGTFQNKASLINHMKGKGVKIDDELFKKLKHM
ncbi:50S ribosomal protein L19e [Candidatus Marsarchaeota archaeon]|jgi:large subunit ribosomal protein L19e|nr:50S ribosomal protein L19e [Candidatus Marsarchaeota archaeon]